MTSEVIRIDIDQMVETVESIGKTKADPGMHKIKEEEMLALTQGCINLLKDKTVEEII